MTSSTLFKYYYIKNIRKRYKNFIGICMNVLKKEYPFTATFKNGEKIQIETLHDLVWLANSDVWKYCNIRDGMLTVSKGDLSAKFMDWRHNGDINGVFVQEVYKSIPIKNETVVDIGANIGTVRYISL